jgi:ABC-type lipoprotein export system ATPase subunit
VLLADEPTGNLDTTTGLQIVELLRTVNRTRRCTLVVVTHDVELARFADETVALRDGAVVEHRVGTSASGATT